MTDQREGINKERQRRALRDLDRVTEQSETIGTSQFSRSANRARDHLMGVEDSASDPTEIWGKRIGRLLGLAFVIGLAVHLYLKYVA